MAAFEVTVPRIPCLFLLGACALLVQGLEAQTTWYVDASATPPGQGTQVSPYKEIQYAIDQPSTLHGDSIQVAFGTYIEHINFKGKALSLIGSTGSSRPLISAGNIGTAVTFENGEGPTSRMRGFRIEHGEGTLIAGKLTGGGILVRGASPHLSNLLVANNKSILGGGMAVLGGSAVVTDRCEFGFNQASAGAGIYVADSTLTVDGGRIRANKNSIGSTQPSRGAGIYATQSTVNLNSIDFWSNWAMGGNGGAVYVGSGGNVTAKSCFFIENRGGQAFVLGSGAAVHALDGAFLAEQCSFRSNGLYTNRGGAGQGGHYDSCSFSLNRAIFGGALDSATAIGCTFVDNFVYSDPTPPRGGALNNCTATNCTLRRNSAWGHGGAAYDSTLIACVLEENRTVDGFNPSKGGGSYGGSASYCLFRNNVAGGSGGEGGGAIYTNLDRCVLVGNHAYLGGGAAYINSGFLYSVLHSSFSSNMSAQGGAIYVKNTTVMLKNSILWGNQPNSIQYSHLPAVAYSIVEGGFPGIGNLNVDPRWFAPWNGDLHLTASSPAIDAGDPMAPPDPDGSIADMGRFPYDPSWMGLSWNDAGAPGAGPIR